MRGIFAFLKGIANLLPRFLHFSAMYTTCYTCKTHMPVIGSIPKRQNTEMSKSHRNKTREKERQNKPFAFASITLKKLSFASTYSVSKKLRNLYEKRLKDLLALSHIHMYSMPSSDSIISDRNKRHLSV